MSVGVPDAPLIGLRRRPALSVGVPDTPLIGAEVGEEGRGDDGEEDENADHENGLRRGSGGGPLWPARVAPVKNKCSEAGKGGEFSPISTGGEPMSNETLPPEVLKARLIRALSGLSQAQMAERIGVDP